MRREISAGSDKEDVMAWRAFLEDHLERIGMSSEQQRFQALKEKHTTSILNWVAEPLDSPQKPLYYMEVEMAQDELDYFLEQYGGTMDPMQVEKRMARLSNQYQRTISSRTTTVMELHVLTQLEN